MPVWAATFSFRAIVLQASQGVGMLAGSSTQNPRI
jgi:hypothetical protein